MASIAGGLNDAEVVLPLRFSYDSTVHLPVSKRMWIDRSQSSKTLRDAIRVMCSATSEHPSGGQVVRNRFD